MAMNIADDLIKDKNRELITVTEDTTIADAVAVMAKNKVGAILIKKGDDLIGIWTERDLLYCVAKLELDCVNKPIGSCMSKNLKFCEWNDSVYKLMDMFLGLRLRHLLVKKDGAYIGMISSGDVMKATIREKNMELSQLNASTSWDYYEEWSNS
jgi:signal-transduction protein with cAMP-binding, CBS, and nucleotidyltransferase domain